MILRNRKMTFRLTEEEYAAIKKKTAESGYSLQAYLLLSALDKEIINTDGIKALIPEIRRIGVNINQVAKHSNQTDSVSSDELSYIRKELTEIWQLLKHQLPTAT